MVSGGGGGQIFMSAFMLVEVAWVMGVDTVLVSVR